MAGLIDHYGGGKAALYLGLAEAALGLSAWHWARAVLNAEPTPLPGPESCARWIAARLPLFLVAVTTVFPFIVRFFNGQAPGHNGLWMLVPAFIAGVLGWIIVWLRRLWVEYWVLSDQRPDEPSRLDPLDPIGALVCYPGYIWRLLRRAPFGALVALALCILTLLFIFRPFGFLEAVGWTDSTQTIPRAPIAAMVSLAVLVPVLTLVQVTLRRLPFLQIAVLLLFAWFLAFDVDVYFPGQRLLETAVAVAGGFLVCMGARKLGDRWRELRSWVPGRPLAAIFATTTTVIMLFFLQAPDGMYDIHTRERFRNTGRQDAYFDRRPKLQDALQDWAFPQRVASAQPQGAPGVARPDCIDWRTRASRADIPVVIVAAEGGALLSAVWTLSVFHYLDDQTDGRFGDSLFAISGVSGGALGAATYREMTGRTAWACDNAGQWHADRWPAGDDRIQSFGLRDFLAPSISAFLLADPVRRLFGALPQPVWAHVESRADALGDAFTAGWQEHADTRANPAFLQEHDLPHLLLNGTDERLGRRIITSTIHFYYPYGTNDPDILDEAEDLLSVVCGDLDLQAAVMTSARFPYISPSGHFLSPGPDCPPRRDSAATRKTNKPPVPHGVVDGGYYDNHGAETALGLATAVTAMRVGDGHKLRPIVVVVSDDADLAPGAMFRDASHCPIANYPNSVPLLPEDIAEARAVRLGSVQTIAPFFTSLNLRGAHDRDGMIRLRRTLCQDPKAPQFIHIALRKPDTAANESAPLNWVLDDASLHFMLSRDTGSALNNAYNCSQINALRSSLGLSADLHCSSLELPVIAAK